MQANEKPLPIGGFTVRAMSQMLHEIAGMIPKEVVCYERSGSSDGIRWRNVSDGCFNGDTWIVPLGGQSVSVDSLVAKRDLVTEIVKEWD